MIEKLILLLIILNIIILIILCVLINYITNLNNTISKIDDNCRYILAKDSFTNLDRCFLKDMQKGIQKDMIVLHNIMESMNANINKK